MYPTPADHPRFDAVRADRSARFTLHTYGVLLAIAFLAGLWVAVAPGPAGRARPGRITDMAVWVLIAGLVGAKLLLVVVEWRYYARTRASSLDPPERRRLLRRPHRRRSRRLVVRPPPRPAGWQTADVLAPGVVLGQAIGRLGCFAAGCCWGKPTHVPWAVTFTDVYAARAVGTPLDTPLHPTQLYESLATFLIFAFLLWLAPRKRFHGQVVLPTSRSTRSRASSSSSSGATPTAASWFGGVALHVAVHRDRAGAGARPSCRCARPAHARRDAPRRLSVRRAADALVVAARRGAASGSTPGSRARLPELSAARASSR